MGGDECIAPRWGTGHRYTCPPVGRACNGELRAQAKCPVVSAVGHPVSVAVDILVALAPPMGQPQACDQDSHRPAGYRRIVAGVRGVLAQQWKQIHYLLPLLPGMALLLAEFYAADEAFLSHRRVWIVLVVTAVAWTWPVANAVIGMRGNATWYVAALMSAVLLTLGAWAVRHLRTAKDSEKLPASSLASLLAVISAVLLIGTHVKAHMDPQELADAVSDLQCRDIVVVAVSDEPGMVTYLARLPKPLPIVANTKAWAASHPQGLALVHASRGAPPDFVQTPITLADGWEGIVPASRLREVHP